MGHPSWRFAASAEERTWAEHVIARTIGPDSVAQLLALVEEEGFERGPDAHTVAELLRRVRGIGNICLELASNRAYSRYIRWWALNLIGYLGEERLVGEVARRARLWMADELWEPAEWTLTCLSSEDDIEAQPWAEFRREVITMESSPQPELLLVYEPPATAPSDW